MKTCTPKEWDACRVEKMGCEGCYYNKPDEADPIMSQIIGITEKKAAEYELINAIYKLMPKVPVEKKVKIAREMIDNLKLINKIFN